MADTRPLHHAVALQCAKLRANTVAGQADGGRELLDGPRAKSQQLDQPIAGQFIATTRNPGHGQIKLDKGVYTICTLIT